MDLMVSCIFITFDPKNNINQMEIGNNKYLYYTIIAGCVICMVAVCFNVFTDMELPSRIMAAILGVVITATITQLLLKGQTKKEVGLKRDSKIFEEKLRIYQNYLNVLYQAVKDGELSDSEKLELQFQTSLVAMHCDPENINIVSEAVKGVIDKTCNKSESGKEYDKKGKINDAELLRSLFEVVGAFKKDLYDKDVKWFDKDDEEEQPKENKDNQQQIGENNGAEENKKEGKKLSTKTIAEKFSEAFSNANEGSDTSAAPQKLSVDLNSTQLLQSISALLNSQASTQTNNSQVRVGDISTWEKATSEWKSKGWKIDGPVEADGDWLRITEENNPGVISMGFYKDHYYIQAEYGDDVEFSKKLKGAKGGSRQKGAWWKYLPEPYYALSKGELKDVFDTDVKLQEYLINRINYLQDVILKYNRTVQWKNVVDKNMSNNWDCFVWNWECLVCQSEIESEGRPYILVVPVQDGDKTLVKFRLGNRAENENTLKDTLRNHGFSAQELNKADCWACVGQVDSLDASKIAEKANELMQKFL